MSSSHLEQWRTIGGSLVEQIAEQSGSFLAFGWQTGCSQLVGEAQPNGSQPDLNTPPGIGDCSCGLPGLDPVEMHSSSLLVDSHFRAQKEKPLFPSLTWIGQCEGRSSSCRRKSRLQAEGARLRRRSANKRGFFDLGDNVARSSLQFLSSRWSSKRRGQPLSAASCTQFVFIGDNAEGSASSKGRDSTGGWLNRAARASGPPFASSRWSSRRRQQPLSATSCTQFVSAGASVDGTASKEELDSTGGWANRAARASMESRVLMKNISTWERASIGAAAGGVAGAFTYACLHPLDTIKTRLQARGAAEIYSGPVDVAVKILKAKGILGFYSGISAVIFGSMLSSAVYFGTCEFGKAFLAGRSSCPPLLIPPISAAMGNIVSSAILVPKEVITQRMQAGAVGRSWEVFLRTVQREGVKGLYAGYSAALTRNLPASVLSFSSFEYLKAGWLRKTGKTNLEPWESVTSGALAGVISAALTTPLDVAKTRLMTQAKRSVLLGTDASQANLLAEAELTAKIAASTYKGLSSTLKRIWVEEGWLGLTRGVGPRLLYSACFSALGYFAFETARITFLKQHLARKGNSEEDALKVGTAPLAVS